MARAVESFQLGRRREASFRIVFDTYHRPVRAFFAKRLASRDECLDLTQETFLRVYKGLDGYRGDAPFGAWLFRIAWNVLRRRRGNAASAAGLGRPVAWQQAEAEAEKALARDAGAPAADGERALDAVLDRERRQQLRRAVERLPAKRRRCMILWAYHELTYEQIAAVMGLALGTVKAHLAQARQQLETLLPDPNDRSGP